MVILLINSLIWVYDNFIVVGKLGVVWFFEGLVIVVFFFIDEIVLGFCFLVVGGILNVYDFFWVL